MKLIIAHIKANLFCIWPPHIFQGWQILTEKVKGKTTLVAVSRLEFSDELVLTLPELAWRDTHFKIFYKA